MKDGYTYNITTKNIIFVTCQKRIALHRIDNDTAQKMMTDIFPFRHQGQCSNLGNWSDFNLPNVRTINYGVEKITCLGPTIWESIPANTKDLDAIKHLQSDIKEWKPIYIHI